MIAKLVKNDIRMDSKFGTEYRIEVDVEYGRI